MLARREDAQSARLLHRLDSLIANFREITSVNRNVGFFTTGYNWMIQIIPALIIAPAYIAGKVEFGVITQSAMAFSTAVAAFSLIVTHFQSLSAFAAVSARLHSMADALDQAQAATPGIEIVESDKANPAGWAALIRAFEAKTGVKILEGYGLTEGACGSSVNPPAGERLAGSIGLPIPYQRMAAVILDGEGRFQRMADVDEVGVIGRRGRTLGLLGLFGHVAHLHAHPRRRRLAAQAIEKLEQAKARTVYSQPDRKVGSEGEKA